MDPVWTAVDLELDGALLRARLELGDTSLYRIRELERRPRNHHLAGVDPRHLEQIIDEPRALVGSGGR